jgi:hypothetical protein
MEHHMSPTGVAVLLLMAFAVDYISIGPNWLRDRIAFTMYIAAIYEGFNGSRIDAWTLERLTGIIRWALDQPMFTGAYIVGASAAAVVGVLVFVVWVYGVGCLLPTKASKRLGRFASINFPASGVWAVNGRLLAVAIILALFGDVPVAWVGDLTTGSNQMLAQLYAPLPRLLLGGN